MNTDQSLFYIIGGTIIALYMLIKIVKKFLPGTSKGVSYVRKGNPDAQFLYDEKYKDKNPLTRQEKMEMSWQFLYDITDTVLNKFSAEDKENINQLGHQLLDSGAGYEHVVEFGLKKENKVSKLAEEAEKEQNSSIKQR